VGDLTKEQLEKIKAYIAQNDEEKAQIEEQASLEQAINRFNKNSLLHAAALKKQAKYEQKGAEFPFIYEKHCDKVGRNVFFIEYEFNGNLIKDACLESSRVSPRCPFSSECEYNKKDAIGKKMSGCIRIKPQ